MPADLISSTIGLPSTYIDISQFLRFGDSLVSMIAISQWNKGLTPPVNWVYFGTLILLLMSYVSAAYTAWQTVIAAISSTQGFYVNYANYSSFTNYMFLYEVIVIIMFLLWSLTVTILATMSAQEIWRLMDERLAEVGDSIVAASTPLTWDKGFKHLILCIMAGMVTMISSYALASTADELISFFDGYDVKNEATDKTDPTQQIGQDGFAARQDLVYHLVTTIYGYLVLSVFSYGGYIFLMEKVGFSDAFTCDLQESTIFGDTYADIFPIMENWTTISDCKAEINKVFEKLDLDRDGFIDRCEDATFLRAMGQSKDYALKFSAPFTPESFAKTCEKMYQI